MIITCRFIDEIVAAAYDSIPVHCRDFPVGLSEQEKSLTDFDLSFCCVFSAICLLKKKQENIAFLPKDVTQKETVICKSC